MSYWFNLAKMRRADVDQGERLQFLHDGCDTSLQRLGAVSEARLTVLLSQGARLRDAWLSRSRPSCSACAGITIVVSSR
jgi:hypothetical protein